MATAAEDFDTILSQLRARIIAVTASNNPDYSVAGRSISKGAYLSQLMNAYEKFQALRQDADGAWQIDVRGKT